MEARRFVTYRGPDSRVKAKRGQKFVYALVDPRNGLRRYVGVTNNINLRVMAHMSLSKSRRSPLHRWLRKLFMDGRWPRVEILATVKQAKALEAEADWIARCDRQSLLLNIVGADEPVPRYRAILASHNTMHQALKEIDHAYVDLSCIEK